LPFDVAQGARKGQQHGKRCDEGRGPHDFGAPRRCAA
jgi:hypothetical protein